MHKRPLAENVNWDQATKAVQNLDWENNPDDFKKLSAYVYKSVQKELALDFENIRELVPDKEFQAEIRASARRYQDRFGALGFYVSLRLKFFVRKRLAKRPG
jgi:hypothetical protein